MPKGKGTYGSKVGRPSKKEYFGGGTIDARDRSQTTDFGTMYKEGGTTKKVDDSESGKTYPKPGEPGYWDYAVQPAIDREEKRKKEASKKKEEEARRKKEKERDKKDKEEGFKKYSPHWGATKVPPSGGGRE